MYNLTSYIQVCFQADAIQAHCKNALVLILSDGTGRMRLKIAAFAKDDIFTLEFMVKSMLLPL